MSEFHNASLAEIARINMVESQLRPNRVHDGALLEAMLNVPREVFLPDEVKPLAYADSRVKITQGRYLTEPLITARLLDYAQIERHHRILVMGGLSPYVATIAARLGAQIVAVEDNDLIRWLGGEALARLKIENVSLRGGNLTEGAPDASPFDIVVIDGAVAEVPQALLDQVALGGRLVVVEASGEGKSHGIVIERIGQIYSRRVVFDAFTPYLPGFEPKLQFEFS